MTTALRALADLDRAAYRLVKAMEGVRLPFKGDAWERLLDLRSALSRAREVLAAAEPSPGAPPPVCTGSGTVMADFMSIGTSLPYEGLCGICHQRVPLMMDAQTIAPHPYLPVPSPSPGAVAALRRARGGK